VLKDREFHSVKLANWLDMGSILCLRQKQLISSERITSINDFNLWDLNREYPSLWRIFKTKKGFGKFNLGDITPEISRQSRTLRLVSLDQPEEL